MINFRTDAAGKRCGNTNCTCAVRVDNGERPSNPRRQLWRRPLPNSLEKLMTDDERDLPRWQQPLRGQLIRRMPKGI